MLHYARLVLALVVISVLSCSTPQIGQQLNANTNYRMEMPVKINGTDYAPASTVPLLLSTAGPAPYMIEFKTKDKPQIITVASCHREESLPPNGSDQSYLYIATPIEMQDACPIHISTFSQKIWYRAAVLMFENPSVYSVQGSVTCNGNISNANGVGLCQAKAGLLEQVTFVNPMNIGSPAQGCAIPSRSSDSRTWTWALSSGECQYKMGEQANPQNLFLMTTEGYDSYLLPNGGS